MLVMTRAIVVEKGHADKVIERFSGPSKFDGREGLVDVNVMVNKRTKEHDEVLVVIRWESEEAWKAWEKSPEHIQGHRDSKGQQPPEYIISTTVNLYDVKAVKQGPASQG
ncbi:antibiotic biosynthesis monooxygenase [Cohnella fermenti]|uniref:Antibiotic biosynthesis monooxygenase n=1 Tax=Cohnella fermenti TaxID=2565925 RepID=A0A4S4BUL7_9BACL|nr:antibiotic biosynthesis monooxygenase [Cohnella fermenti]THF78799.1 antibiotic biosynthesis monooxygenase [Cohnella fermenti]